MSSEIQVLEDIRLRNNLLELIEKHASSFIKIESDERPYRLPFKIKSDLIKRLEGSVKNAFDSINEGKDPLLHKFIQVNPGFEKFVLKVKKEQITAEQFIQLSFRRHELAADERELKIQEFSRMLATAWLKMIIVLLQERQQIRLDVDLFPDQKYSMLPEVHELEAQITVLQHVVSAVNIKKIMQRVGNEIFHNRAVIMLNNRIRLECFNTFYLVSKDLNLF